MEFRILGPLEVSGEDGASVTIGGSRERGVLALLLLSANRVVSSERLAADLWGDRAPEGATHALRVYVSRLRRALREAGAEGVLATQSPGYVARIPPGALDAARFEALLGRGREAASGGDHQAAAELLREALALWRGPALADLPEAPVARAEAIRLEEARLVALEERIDADLACGRQAELVGELEGLTQVHPLRERLWYLRMLALYRAGRQAEALGAYMELRRLLDDELGIAPSEPLTRLQTAILRQDPKLALRPVQQAAPAAASATDVVTVLVTELDVPGDEEAQWIFHAYRNLVVETATEHGGYELQSPGRGIAAAFSSAAHALQVALSMQRGAPRPLGSQQVAVRIGLDAGPSPRERVIVARRLCEQAEAGRILCTKRVRDLLGGRLPEVAVVWEEPQATAGYVPMPPLLTDIGRVFVGRTPELRRLTQLWTDVGSVTPRMIVLSGEPGVGKTRLAAEFARQVHAEGRMVLAGRCDEDLGVPYQPFVEALRQFVDHTPATLLDGGLAGTAGNSFGWCPRSHGGGLACPRRCGPIPRPSATGSSMRSPPGSAPRPVISPCSWCLTTCTGRPSQPCCSSATCPAPLRHQGSSWCARIVTPSSATTTPWSTSWPICAGKREWSDSRCLGWTRPRSSRSWGRSAAMTSTRTISP
jgi:DNA-binding SARP family transcriptional activator